MAYYQVSGYIRNSSGSPIPGCELWLQSPTGALLKVETNYQGYYLFPTVEAKATAYNLWPARAGIVFDPSMRTFIVDGNKTKDFTATSSPVGRHSFSGTIIGATGTSIRVRRRISGGDVYIWTYSDPTTGAWKIWYAAGTAGDYEIAADDPSGVYTLTPASTTVSYSSSDITGINFTATASVGGYDLYGYVRDGSAVGQNGITVTAKGRTYPFEMTTVTANFGSGDGEYRFSEVDEQVYDIVPSFAGATFAPTAGTGTVAGSDTHGTDFVVTYAAGSHAISGTLTGNPVGTLTSYGPRMVRATNTTSGVSYDCMSDASGDPRNYSIPGVPDGTYSVQPFTMTGGTWSGPLTVTVAGADVPGQNFIFTAGTTGTGSISGTITLNGAVMPGVTVELRDGTPTGTLLDEATTGTGGTYSFTLLPDDTYCIVPYESGYTFSPTTRTIATVGAAVTGQDFSATLTGGGGGGGDYTYTISGFCYQGTSTGVPGVLVKAGAYSATTDAYGNYAITGVAIGTYTVTATKSGYTFTASGFTNPVTVGYGNVEDIDFLGTGGTGGGGGGSEVAVPYVFTNAHDNYTEAIDADKLNANFDTLADGVNNIGNSNVSESAGIDPTKIGSSLGKANLEADVLYLDELVDEVLEVDPDFVKYSILPSDEDGIELSGGADGSVTVAGGKHLLLQGKRFELTTTTLPAEGTLAAQSVYALRARLVTAEDVEDDDSLTEGALKLYLVPLAGNCLGSGDTGSTKYTVAQITGATSGSKFTATGMGTAPLIGAYGVCLDSSYEKFFIAYNNGSTIMLADALGATPTTDSRIGLIIDDPDYEDDPGELGGVSTPSDALIAIIWCGTSGQAPYVQKIIRRSYEVLGKPTTISSSWSDRATLADDDGTAGYDEVQLTLPTAITAPTQLVTITAALYDTNSGDPTDATGIFFGPISSLAFKLPDVPYPKGVQLRVTPEKLVARFAKGKLRILSGVADEGTAVKSARFKAVVTI
jgi:hypothetical protein